MAGSGSPACSPRGVPDLPVPLLPWHLGSSTTLIACECRGRKARLLELDPKYADVIVRRYQEYSGKPAVLDDDGRTFPEIALERFKEAA